MDKQKQIKYMNMAHYQYWYDVIVRDDAHQAESILNSASPPEKDLLLKGTFEFEEFGDHGMAGKRKYRIRLPFHLAVAFCCKKIIKLFMTYDINVECCDQFNRNALHSCVSVAFSFPDMEAAMSQLIPWFEELVGLETFCRMQSQENCDRLRPLEYAAQQGCLQVMSSIFQTRGNVSTDTINGLGRYGTHDITDYENGPRHSLSPLHMIAYLDQKKLQHSDTVSVLLSRLIRSWVDGKLKSNRPFIILWVLFRMIYVLCFYAVDADVAWLVRRFGNESNELLCPDLSLINLPLRGKNIMSTMIFVLSVLMLFLDTVNLFQSRYNKQHLKYYDIDGRKTLICNTMFFKYNDLLLVLMITFCIACYIAQDTIGLTLPPDLIIFGQLVRGCVPLLCLHYLSYFLMLFPYVGKTVTTVQSMLLDTARFIVIFFLWLLPFVHLFTGFVQIRSNTGCVPEFSSFPRTIYTLFLVMLNVYDLSGLDVSNAVVLYVFHVLFVLIIAVLLLNFLIAIMSTSASKVENDKQVILMLNQLAIVVRLEENIFWLTKLVYKKLRRFGFHCTGDKVLIRSFSFRKEQFKVLKDC